MLNQMSLVFSEGQVGTVTPIVIVEEGQQVCIEDSHEKLRGAAIERMPGFQNKLLGCNICCKDQ
jgi:hypothetical protein